MGFLAPWFLAGLVALGLPVYLHLLRRHKIEPKPFPSIMFFERRMQSSVRHRRLRFYLLLGLRLAMLALLALLFAQPFVYRQAAGAGSKKLVVFAVDHSFSMRAADRLDAAKRAASAAVDSMPGGASGQVVAVGSRVETRTQPVADRGALKAAIEGIEPGDGASSYSEFSRFVRGLPSALNVAVEAHLFSDMQQTSLPAAFTDLALGERTKLVLHPVGNTTPNWTVEAVTVPHSVHGSEKVRVQATIAGFGTEAARRTVSLIVNDRIVETKTIEVPAAGRARVEFAGFEPAYGFNRGEVRMEPRDSLSQDDHYLFSSVREETRKVLLVRDTRQNPQFFRAALESAAADTYDVDVVTAEQAANLDPNKYALVVLADAAGIAAGFEDRLTAFVQHGGGLLVEVGPACVARGRVPVVKLNASESKYASRSGDRFQAAARVDGSHGAIRDKSALENVKFYRTARVQAGDARVLASLSDDSPLLLEKRLGEGTAIIVASTLDNLANDFPVRASFVPFVGRVASYLSGPASGPSSGTVGSTVVLRAENEMGTAVDVFDPTGHRALDLNQAANTAAFLFPREGFWETRSANGRRDLHAINADRRESDLARIPDETLALWRGAGDGTGTGSSGLPAQPERLSLWKYVLMALLALGLAESLIADRFRPAAEPKDSKPLVKREAA